MRHRKNTVKLGRRSEHRAALLISLVNNLIAEKKICTTLPKARLCRTMAEKMVTIGKAEVAAAKPEQKLAARRRLLQKLRHEKHVVALVNEIVPKMSDRVGGYVRILKLGKRSSDSSEMAVVEWVGITPQDKRKRKKPAEGATEEKKD